MSALSKRAAYAPAQLSLVPSLNGSILRLRLRVLIPRRYLDEPILSRLTSNFGITFNILRASLQPYDSAPGQFDLELRGTTTQLSEALRYLESLQLELRSKPNPDGDSWNI